MDEAHLGRDSDDSWHGEVEQTSTRLLLLSQTIVEHAQKLQHSLLATRFRQTCVVHNKVWVHLQKHHIHFFLSLYLHYFIQLLFLSTFPLWPRMKRRRAAVLCLWTISTLGINLEMQTYVCCKKIVNCTSIILVFTIEV